MNLDYRRDGRTVEEFALDIKYRTAKEKFLVCLYRDELLSMGHEVKIENAGVDNSGKLLAVASCKPDYKVTIDGHSTLLDIKNSPVQNKWTFKTHNLNSYVKNSVSILIFWGSGFIDKNPSEINLDETRFGLISCENIDKMLAEYEHIPVQAFGNKICIVVKKGDFSRWLTIKRITHR